MKHCFHRYNTYLLIIVSLALLVVGCHTTNKVAKVGTVQPSDNCRIIQHELGKTCIPVNLERVVVLDSNIALDPTIALGIKPVGVASFYGREKSFRGPSLDVVEEATNVGSTEQPSVEKVLMLKPDLILASKNQPYQLLSKIAPTIPMPFPNFDQPSDEALFKQALRYVAKIFSKEAKAEELIDQYQKRIEDLQKCLGNQLQQIEASVIFYNTDLVYTPARNYDAIADVLIDLGLRPKLIPASTYLNIENIDQFDTDILFVISDQQKSLSFYQQHPLFSRLKAVKNNRLDLVPPERWDTRGILGANQILDDLFKYLVDEP
ncbi:MAG: iron-siderophore ABC transporter substrate-binding protein [Goleter apudmare HA4340-LM2]|jgi:iron complex transport system substrate-binding protein|nr:iron-siderophore ABC transporter substrate-binding protein [Goleter apudmare HA4340-LM2]